MGRGSQRLCAAQEAGGQEAGDSSGVLIDGHRCVLTREVDGHSVSGEGAGGAGGEGRGVCQRLCAVQEANGDAGDSSGILIDGRR
jgi:hypothetical protein